MTMNRLLLLRHLGALRATPHSNFFVCSGNISKFSSTETRVAPSQKRCCSSTIQKPIITVSIRRLLPRWISVQIRHRHHHDRDQQDPDDTNQSDDISAKKKKEEDSSGGSDDRIPKENSAFTASSQWRTRQLQELTTKFQPDIETAEDDDHNHATNDDDESITEHENSSFTTTTATSAKIDPLAPPIINKDDDVQQMWRDMESRVVKRRSMTLAQAKAKGMNVGRRNTRKTDEEAWLSAGLYDTASEDDADDAKSDDDGDNDDPCKK